MSLVVGLLLEELLAHDSKLPVHLLIEVTEQVKHKLGKPPHQLFRSAQVLEVGIRLRLEHISVLTQALGYLLQ